MDKQGFDANYSSGQVQIILKKAIQLCKQGKYLKADELLRAGLDLHPEQKEFLILLGRIEKPVKKQRVERLESEALLLMQSGDLDKAQKVFRRILEIDPTREDLKHSLEKTRSEKFEEIDAQNARRELIRNSIYIALVMATFAALLLGGVFWHNHKQLKQATEFIEYKNYEKAKTILDKRGWLFANKRKNLRNELERIADELWQEALRLGEKDEYDSAISTLEVALSATAAPARFEEQIVQFRERLRQMQEALTYKAACENSADIAQMSNAEKDVRGILQEAEQLAFSAAKLFEVKQYTEAQKTWREAIVKYEEAGALYGIALANSIDPNSIALMGYDPNVFEPNSIAMNSIDPNEELEIITEQRREEQRQFRRQRQVQLNLEYISALKADATEKRFRGVLSERGYEALISRLNLLDPYCGVDIKQQLLKQRLQQQQTRFRGVQTHQQQHQIKTLQQQQREMEQQIQLKKQNPLEWERQQQERQRKLEKERQLEKQWLLEKQRQSQQKN